MVRVLIFVFSLIIAFPGAALSRFDALRWVDNQTPDNVVLLHKELVARIYASNGNQLLWYSDDAINGFEQLLEIVTVADLSDHFFKRLIALKEARAEHQAMAYDIVATDTLLSYISYTELSRENGKDWYFGARIPTVLPEPSERAKVELMKAIQDARLERYLQRSLAMNEEQKMLYGMITQLRHSRFKFSAYSPNQVKRRGDTLKRKRALLERLAIVGVDTTRIDATSTVFDPETEKAVIRFQALHGLKADGIIGRNTLKWLNTPVEERARILALNAERLRVWQPDRDNIMIVNVPDFRLRYWNNGHAYFDTKVIVGRRSRKTPLIDTRMDAVILNPTWNVPRTIMVEDIIPAVQRDKNYIAKHQYEILSDWVSEQSINPDELDWKQVVPEQFPYRFRQHAGPENALGLYKFNTPNRNSIFLHDTPGKSLFDREIRAYSSGCIRVQDADKLANLLLSSRISERTKQEIAAQNISGQANYVISLNRPIPVSIVYQTAWVESGVVQYRNDIYRYDSYAKSDSFGQKLIMLSMADKQLSKQ
ncbi:L,D-transpeptidase family protein [Vibrio sp. HA2012]|uniref:L,D-transpeptidase family protein n=1 Tax=Vibrio sp. HA2012 TaxID=1971595 RepID=UPI001E643D85|nr:L,D-transpeptidase family protein [Vibrio sp. HA2012]